MNKMAASNIVRCVQITDEGGEEVRHVKDTYAEILRKNKLVDYCTNCEQYHPMENVPWQKIQHELRRLALN